MEKTIENAYLYIKGDPAQSNPSGAFMTYDVVAGKGKKTNNVYTFGSFDPAKTMTALWAEGIQEIKTLEGIA